MKLFIPEKVFIDPRSLDYEVGRFAKSQLEKLSVPLIESRRVVIDGKTPSENYAKAKKTIYLTVSKVKKLRPCKPSADYQFALSSSCPGHCEYCYLQTTQGEKPFMRVFVNVDEILQVIQNHIDENLPNITTFESGSITDPIALEHLTGNLKRCIEYFGKSDYKELLNELKSQLGDYGGEITFELIQHRFTATAKELILTRFPKTELNLDEEKRQLKWGPYGKFKYVYPKEESNEMKEYISNLISNNFSNSVIEYFT